VIFYGKKLAAKNVGKRDTFADIGQTIADYLKLPALEYGSSFL
jgi:phosphopentomutase